MGYIQIESYNMSTTTTQIVPADGNGINAAEEIKNELISLEKKMSFYLKNSEVSKINSLSGIKNIEVSYDTLKVIKKSIEYSYLTDGAFDITLAPVIEEWGIFSEHEKVPSPERINELLALVGYENILIDNEKNLAGLKIKDQKIDLGAIAKGYATDKAVQIYKRHDIKSAMINLGGNVSVLGKKEDNEPWTVGIQNPTNPRGEIIGILKCEDTSVVTSGNYVRYFTLGGNSYGHIINSKSGITVNSDLVSATVICKEAIKADALSTAIFTLGKDKALDFIKRNNDISSILITNNNEVYISSDISENFYIVDEYFKYIYF